MMGGLNLHVDENEASTLQIQLVFLKMLINQRSFNHHLSCFDIWPLVPSKDVFSLINTAVLNIFNSSSLTGYMLKDLKFNEVASQKPDTRSRSFSQLQTQNNLPFISKILEKVDAANFVFICRETV